MRDDLALAGVHAPNAPVDEHVAGATVVVGVSSIAGHVIDRLAPLDARDTVAGHDGAIKVGYEAGAARRGNELDVS